jgi:hypothetical protein
LATQTVDPGEKARLFKEAIKGFALYRDTTGPLVMRNLAINPKGTFAGESKETLEQNYKMAQTACAELLKIQSVSPSQLEFNLPEEAAKFAGALAVLNK